MTEMLGLGGCKFQLAEAYYLPRCDIVIASLISCIDWSFVLVTTLV